MTKTMEDWKQESEEKRNEERKRLLAISEADSWKLPITDWYQRIRYQREIEANEWLAKIKMKSVIIEKKQELKKYQRVYQQNWDKE